MSFSAQKLVSHSPQNSLSDIHSSFVRSMIKEYSSDNEIIVEQIEATTTNETSLAISQLLNVSQEGEHLWMNNIVNAEEPSSLIHNHVDEPATVTVTLLEEETADSTPAACDHISHVQTDIIVIEEDEFVETQISATIEDSRDAIHAASPEIHYADMRPVDNEHPSVMESEHSLLDQPFATFFVEEIDPTFDSTSVSYPDPFTDSEAYYEWILAHYAEFEDCGDGYYFLFRKQVYFYFDAALGQYYPYVEPINHGKETDVIAECTGTQVTSELDNVVDVMAIVDEIGVVDSMMHLESTTMLEDTIAPVTVNDILKSTELETNTSVIDVDIVVDFTADVYVATDSNDVDCSIHQQFIGLLDTTNPQVAGNSIVAVETPSLGEMLPPVTSTESVWNDPEIVIDIMQSEQEGGIFNQLKYDCLLNLSRPSGPKKRRPIPTKRRHKVSIIVDVSDDEGYEESPAMSEMEILNVAKDISASELATDCRSDSVQQSYVVFKDSAKSDMYNMEVAETESRLDDCVIAADANRLNGNVGNLVSAVANIENHVCTQILDAMIGEIESHVSTVVLCPSLIEENVQDKAREFFPISSGRSDDVSHSDDICDSDSIEVSNVSSFLERNDVSLTDNMNDSNCFTRSPLQEATSSDIFPPSLVERDINTTHTTTPESDALHRPSTPQKSTSIPFRYYPLRKPTKTMVSVDAGICLDIADNKAQSLTTVVSFTHEQTNDIVILPGDTVGIGADMESVVSADIHAKEISAVMETGLEDDTTRSAIIHIAVDTMNQSDDGYDVDSNIECRSDILTSHVASLLSTVVEPIVCVSSDAHERGDSEGSSTNGTDVSNDMDMNKTELLTLMDENVHSDNVKVPNFSKRVLITVDRPCKEYVSSYATVASQQFLSSHSFSFVKHENEQANDVHILDFEYLPNTLKTEPIVYTHTSDDCDNKRSNLVLDDTDPDHMTSTPIDGNGSMELPPIIEKSNVLKLDEIRFTSDLHHEEPPEDDNGMWCIADPLPPESLSDTPTTPISVSLINSNCSKDASMSKPLVSILKTSPTKMNQNSSSLFTPHQPNHPQSYSSFFPTMDIRSTFHLLSPSQKLQLLKDHQRRMKRLRHHHRRPGHDGTISNPDFSDLTSPWRQKKQLMWQVEEMLTDVAYYYVSDDDEDDRAETKPNADDGEYSNWEAFVDHYLRDIRQNHTPNPTIISSDQSNDSSDRNDEEAFALDGSVSFVSDTADLHAMCMTPPDDACIIT